QRHEHQPERDQPHQIPGQVSSPSGSTGLSRRPIAEGLPRWQFVVVKGLSGDVPCGATTCVFYAWHVNSSWFWWTTQKRETVGSRGSASASNMCCSTTKACVIATRPSVR